MWWRRGLQLCAFSYTFACTLARTFPRTFSIAGAFTCARTGARAITLRQLHPQQ